MGLDAFTAQDLTPLSEDGKIMLDVALGGQRRRMVLQKHSLRAPGFRALAQEGGGSFRDAPVPECQTYRGYVADCGGSCVAASMSGDGLRAVVRLGSGDASAWVVEPLRTVMPGAPAWRHLVYSGAGSRGGSWVCGNHDVPAAPKTSGAAPVSCATAKMDVMVCQIACDADYEYYALNGSSVSNTVADIEAILNGVSAIYERDVGLSFQLTQILVRLAEPDPYDATAADTLLAQFRYDWLNNHQDIPRAAAHLFTGNSFGSILGDSYTGQVCPGQDHYSWVRSRAQTDVAKRIALSAHEIGHSFNAGHCDYGGDPRCRIMCSSLGQCSGGYNSFEDSSIAEIRATMAASPCLTAGAVTAPTTSLPFTDSFSKVFPSQAPDPAKWTAGDLVDCESQHLAINIGRGFSYNQKIGNVRTLPMALRGPALVQYKVNPQGIPSSQSLKIDYFDSRSFTWQNLRTITSDGSTDFHSYQDNVPVSAAGDCFAVRFSAYAAIYTASYAWWLDDVSIAQAPGPQLSIARTPTNTMVLSWPQPAPDWKLETTGALSNGAGVWTLIAPPYPTNSSAVLFTDTAPLSIRFYRLRAP